MISKKRIIFSDSDDLPSTNQGRLPLRELWAGVLSIAN
jgi:hypothetical protein